MKASMLFKVFATLFAGFWLFMAGRGIVHKLKERQQLNWLVAIAGLLLMIGAGGFFATMLAATGVIAIPDTFEWPPGYVRGVVETSGGKYLVPIVPAGRLQIYDSNWHFLRGWQVDAGGGDFTVDYSPNNEILISTSRKRRRYLFTENGKLISEMSLPDSLVVTASGNYMSVPTWRLLWIFSSPSLSWGVALIGMAGLWAADKFQGSKKQPSTNHSV